MGDGPHGVERLHSRQDVIIHVAATSQTETSSSTNVFVVHIGRAGGAVKGGAMGWQGGG